MTPTNDQPVEGLVSPELEALPEPPVVEEVRPIMPGDAEGRQPGMPDEPIELPAYITHEHVPTFPVIAGLTPPTEEEMLKAMGIKPAEAPAAFPASTPPPVPQTPPVMPPSFAGGALVNEETGMASIEQAPPGTVISAQTLAELAYGAKVVERNRQAAIRNRVIAAQAAARRLASGAPADAEDLNYPGPRV